MKNELIYWSKRLYDKDMAPSTSGNISYRLNDEILISASGVCLGDLSENEIAKVDINGNSLDNNIKPSSEKNLHCMIYKKRFDINAIIHSHCPYITAFAVCGLEINKPILPDFALQYTKIPIVDYYCPSTLNLANETSKYFDKYSIVLLKNHGVVVGSDNLKNAFYKLEAINAYAKTYLFSKLLGDMKKLSRKNIAEIKNLFK